MGIWLIIIMPLVIALSFDITRYAGSGEAGYNDNSLLDATFNSPSGIVIDEFGWMMIADSVYNSKN
jgi:hypothetical protein